MPVRTGGNLDQTSSRGGGEKQTDSRPWGCVGYDRGGLVGERCMWNTPEVPGDGSIIY